MLDQSVSKPITKKTPSSTSISTKPETKVKSVPSSSSKELISETSSAITLPKFDIIDHINKTKISMSQAEYLKSNKDQLEKLVQFIKGDSTVHSSKGILKTPKDGKTQNIVAATTPSNEKIEPFFVSFLINGCKLSNCIIDSGASDNVMPEKVAHALGLTCTRTFGSCYSMETKQVPLIGQIKDAQMVLAQFPQKRVKVTILVADIPASYGMLLSRKFCRDLGGEIQMDWSHAMIPINGEMKKLMPEAHGNQN